MKHSSIHWAVDRILRGDTVWPWSEQSVRKHLSGCERCRQYYDEGVLLLRAARGQMDAAGSGELGRMLARAVEASDPPLPAARTWARARWALVAAAAVIAVGFWLADRPAELGRVVTAGRLVVDGALAEAGMRLYEGQDVVASGGSGVVRLNGGRGVLIQEGSRLRFEERGARAIVVSGGGYFRVDKGVGRFEVEAGTATVVVKGTRFLVERKDLTRTSVVVDEGLVEVRTTKGSVQVAEGQQTTVAGDTVAAATDIDLLERIKRGLQRFAREVERAFAE